MIRTPTQRDANEIDMELFRLLTRAERLYSEPGAGRAQREHVTEACHGIRSARARIRLLMHEADRAATS